MFNTHTMQKFMNMLDAIEDLEKPITYYNLRNLKHPLSNELIKECLDFCVGFCLLHKQELIVNGRQTFRYSKTILWFLLEDYTNIKNEFT